MKITKLVAVCFSFVLSTSLAFASSSNLNEFYSTMHPSTSNAIKNMLHPPVDITVINATSNYIYVVIPNSPVNDYISPGFNEHIHNYDANVYSAYVVLQDVYRNTFYANTVCRVAILTVYGYQGNYTINYDSDLCL